MMGIAMLEVGLMENSIAEGTFMSPVMRVQARTPEVSMALGRAGEVTLW
jgi:hypothetical protein